MVRKRIFILVISLLLLLLFHVSTVSGRRVTFEKLCPVACTCDADLSSMLCVETTLWESTWQDIRVTNERQHIRNLAYRGHIPSVPKEVKHLHNLAYLNLSESYLQNVHSKAFGGLSNLKILDLSVNQISSVDEDAFFGLVHLQVLNLSNNHLKSLPGKVFQGLRELQVLVLAGNELARFPADIFYGIQDLNVLDISHNSLSFLASSHIEGLQRLQRLDLSHNTIPSLHPDVSGAITNIPGLSIDLSDNPLDCTCALHPLLDLINSGNTSFANLDRTVCMSPEAWKERQVGRLLPKQFECRVPEISFLSDDQIAYYSNLVELQCRVVGTPIPAVVWETPWGENFAHASQFHLLGDWALNITSHEVYKAKSTYEVSTVTAKEDGTLIMESFRGYFNGNFTCFAVNSLGNTSSTTVLTISSHISDVYLQSLIMAASCTGAFFAFGILVGVIRLIVITIRRRCCGYVEEKKEKVATLDEIEVGEPNSDDDDYDNHYDDDDDSSGSPPPTPATTPKSNSPTSPQKCSTPTEDNPTGFPSNIVDTLDEVRWRLRYGVERKMEKVRSHVKSIKESSTLYVHSIMESGSQAADRVKAGVVMGVETVKYHVQSFKELCGTGDMGGQTISMVSVSTDVDTDQKTQVVKSVTYV